MEKKSVFRGLLVMALSLLLCSACAKKPVSVEEGYGSGEASAVSSEFGTPGYGGIDESAIGADAAMDAEDDMFGTAGEIDGLERIFFKFDQYTLTPDARETLAGNARFLQANPELMVKIEGHCDERGSDEYNLALGERRARSVQSYMVSLGVPASRMSIISYGEEIPLDPQSTEDAWAKNRRAEFKRTR